MSARARRAARLCAGLAILVAWVGCNAGTPPIPAPVARSADFTLAGDVQQGGWLRGTAPAGTVELTFDGQAVPLAPDGAFLVAFDRDAKPAAVLAARLADGGVVSRDLVVPARAWRIEQINAPMRPPSIPSEEFQRLRAAELARINAARALASDSGGWRQAFVWPATGRLSGQFGSQRVYQGVPGSYHSGADIAGATGTPFVAPADGVVILAAESPFTIEGNLLMIDHGMGLNSAFLHCSQLLVHEGERVKQGQVIGRIGMTGRATGPHLHWSLKWRSARVDPLLFAGPMR